MSRLIKRVTYSNKSTEFPGRHWPEVCVSYSESINCEHSQQG